MWEGVSEELYPIQLGGRDLDQKDMGALVVDGGFKVGDAATGTVLYIVGGEGFAD